MELSREVWFTSPHDSYQFRAIRGPSGRLRIGHTVDHACCICQVRPHCCVARGPESPMPFLMDLFEALRPTLVQHHETRGTLRG